MDRQETNGLGTVPEPVEEKGIPSSEASDTLGVGGNVSEPRDASTAAPPLSGHQLLPGPPVSVPPLTDADSNKLGEPSASGEPISRQSPPPNRVRAETSLVALSVAVDQEQVEPPPPEPTEKDLVEAAQSTPQVTNDMDIDVPNITADTMASSSILPEALSGSPVNVSVSIESKNVPDSLAEPSTSLTPTGPEIVPVEPVVPPAIKESTLSPVITPESGLPPENEVQHAQPTTNYSPEASQSRAGDGKQLDVSDALSYLDAVRQQFHDRPDVYNLFLDIMKDFKSQLIDTPGVIERVSTLFSGHPLLIQGFNTFLPVGYRIECSVDAQDANLITVTTPSGTTTQSTGGKFLKVNPRSETDAFMSLATADAARVLGQGVYSPAPHLSSTSLSSSLIPFERSLPIKGLPYTQEDISPAMEYLTKIKQRFANDMDLYQEFVDILSVYQSGLSVDEGQFTTRIAKLFQNAPDLLSDFQVFMPQGILPNHEVFRAFNDKEEKGEKSSKKKGDASAASGSTATVPQKRKRKLIEKDKEREKEKEKEKEKERELASKAGPTKTKKQKHQHNVIQADSAFMQHAGPSSPSHRAYDNTPLPHPVQPPALDDTLFFDRVRRALDNRETYNEFLKLLNLFTQDIIDMRKLVEQAYTFLGESELMVQFKDILGWDARWEQDRYYPPHAAESYGRGFGTSDRTNRADMDIKHGPSYRRLPASEINVTCSGRDEMCRSVLNDEWVSHPTWASEDAGFVAHRKNAYEEALHRSEEERHEYDFHIEAIVRTIALLEPIHGRMAQMRPEERSAYKLKPNMSGSSKSIHQRIIKKIYGREAGLEVLDALNDCPSLAVPIVLTRLKQKEEEWKRAQREWNKVWREVDARNYQKSLDHQGVTFKANDKKAITNKAFVNQIELAREEQITKRASLVDPLFARTRPHYQLALFLDDPAVLQDLLKLSFSFLDRLQNQLSPTDRGKIESFLRSFIPLLFMLEPITFNAAFGTPKELWDPSTGMDTFQPLSDIDEHSVPSGVSRNGRNGRRSGNDLRKKLLKNNTRDKSSKMGAGTTSNSSSRQVSPTLTDDPMSQASTSLAEIPRNSKDGFVQPPPPYPSATSTNLAAGDRRTSRRGSFFTNSSLYSLLRLIELLYSRLLTCKSLAAKLASGSGSSYLSNPVAQDLALLDTAAPVPGLVDIQERPNPAAYFYEYLLESCERLFDNDIDQSTFEEITRYMFGTKAYIMFTIDKVIGALVKQVQNALSDSKCLELLEALKRERELASLTSQDHLNYRHQAESIVGPDENLFRIDWLPESQTMTIQLLGKDDSRFDDSEIITGRWQAYVESYVSDTPTSGLPATKIKSPFLRRTLQSISPQPLLDNVQGHNNLGIKVCVGTYRFFFVVDSEDVLWRNVSPEELVAGAKRASMRALASKRWLERLDKYGTVSR